ncbi:MAG: substrate-binding domain-containing protein [Gammaproteobacteria bacterium]
MNFKITAAVAAALACSAPAFALDVAGTNGATVQLTAAGASAQRDAFLVMMINTICQPGTFDMYRASPTVGQDFRAYSCRITNDGTAYGAAANQTATVYYRSEGGSALGIVPIATNTPVMRLAVDAACSNTATATIAGAVSSYSIHDCVLPAANNYVLVGTTAANADVSSTTDPHFVKDTVDLGIADVEPKLFAGVNFPSSHVFDGFPAAQRQPAMTALNALAQVGFGQVFGVIVNNTAAGQIGNNNTGTTASPFNGQGDNFGTPRPVLSKQSLAAIFRGTYTNWNQVPTITGGRVSSTPLTIRVCRREPGSGTQVAANQYFLGTNQCSPPAPQGNFRTDNTDADDLNFVADTNGVIERGTGGDLNTCVAGLAGGIGITVANAAPGGVSYVAINGSEPTRNAAAIGNYDYWFEQTFVVNPNLAAGAVVDLANGLIKEASNANSAPNALSVVSLPNETNDPTTQGPFVSTKPPIAFGIRGGNSCVSSSAL